MRKEELSLLKDEIYGQAKRERIAKIIAFATVVVLIYGNLATKLAELYG